jgi:hypothetical protein
MLEDDKKVRIHCVGIDGEHFEVEADADNWIEQFLERAAAHSAERRKRLSMASEQPTKSKKRLH